MDTKSCFKLNIQRRFNKLLFLLKNVFMFQPYLGTILYVNVVIIGT